MPPFEASGRNSGRFSGGIWKGLPPMIERDPTVGLYACETFTTFGLTTPVATNVAYYSGTAGPYKSYEDDTCAITQDPTALGTMKMSIVATDNKEAWLQSNSGVGVLGKITSGTSGRKQLFETRIALGQIVTQNFFVGLMEEGCAAHDLVSDAGGLPDKDYIGFWVAEAASSVLYFAYKKAGQTAQTVLTPFQTLAVDTYYNVGWVFDPDAPAAERLRIYLNGAKQSSFVTSANIAAATFPSGEEMAFTIGGKTSGAAAKSIYCQGWRFAQPF